MVSVAICDYQEKYRERLAQALMRKKGEEMDISTFSNRRSFRQEGKHREFQIVLWGKGFEEILHLPKEGSLYIFLSEENQWEAEQEPAVFKYQSSEEIIRNIFRHYLETKKINPGINQSPKEIIGVYSPTHSRLQTPFALTLAQVCAEEKKVLYLNFGEWAGFSQLMQQEYHRDLSDLLYLISGYGSQTQGLLECVLHSSYKIDYVPPMTDARLLCETSDQEYQELIRFVLEKTDYDVIVLDFGIMIPGFFSILEQCTGIYGVVDQGILARGQRQQFEDSIMREGKRHLAEKIIYIPFRTQEAEFLEQEPVLNQWLYGELGIRARAARHMNDGRN